MTNKRGDDDDDDDDDDDNDDGDDDDVMTTTGLSNLADWSCDCSLTLTELAPVRVIWRLRRMSSMYANTPLLQKLQVTTDCNTRVSDQS